MRDAIGGVLSLQIVLIFLLIINSYLAFSVNYTKAFRIKNKIISIIENYEGLTGGENGSRIAIEEMMFQNNYSINPDIVNKCGYARGLERYKAVTSERSGSKAGYCYYITPTSITGQNLPDETYKGAVYSIAVFINIDLPVINKLFPFLANTFAIKGETKTIYSSGFDTELEDGWY